MPKYWVPVLFEVSGEVAVEASSPKEALQKAKDLWSKKGQKCITAPTMEVDFAHGDDLEEVQSEDEV